MLRITPARGPAGAPEWKLEGLISAGSLRTLEGELARAAESPAALDLADVTYVDREGRAWLRRARERLELRNVPPFVEALLAGPPAEEER